VTGDDGKTRRDVQAAARSWLEEYALPVWLDRGVDRARGGYYDSLTLGEARNAAPYKRLRVLTRQIYVFSFAARLGVAGASDAVYHGLDFLLGPARNPDGGFSCRFDLDGRTIDDRRDLYDLAFVVFALGHAYRLKPDALLRDEALQLLAFVSDRMRHPAGGYLESIPPVLPRRQNPHMHLLEAALVWADLEPDGAFAALALELADLFTAHLYQPHQGVVLEYYGQEWQTDGERKVVEPGHQFEWAWLLSRLSRHGRSQGDAAAALMNFAHHHGRDEQSGLLYGELDLTGEVVTAAVRVWPHTEWLKAEVTSGTSAGVVAAWSAIDRFLQVPTRGLWTEIWDPANRQFSDGPAPATTLYHIAMAIETALADT